MVQLLYILWGGILIVRPPLGGVYMSDATDTWLGRMPSGASWRCAVCSATILPTATETATCPACGTLHRIQLVPVHDPDPDTLGVHDPVMGERAQSSTQRPWRRATGK